MTPENFSPQFESPDDAPENERESRDADENEAESAEDSEPSVGKNERFYTDGDNTSSRGVSRFGDQLSKEDIENILQNRNESKEDENESSE